MKRKYIGLYLFLLLLLFLFPPCIGRGNGYYVGHTFILNVGTFVDVPTGSGVAKYVSFIAEIAWQKVAIEILAITAFVGMLYAFNAIEHFRAQSMTSLVVPPKLIVLIRWLLLPATFAITGLYLIDLSLSEQIGPWGYLGLIVFLMGSVSLFKNYKKL